MMKKWLLFVCFFSAAFCNAEEIDLDRFLHAYPFPLFQDIIVHKEVVREGTNFCSARYEMIKPVLDLYRKPFKVLDLGAAQGYFSFRIANDYPQATCVMVEAESRKSQGVLNDLCLLNHLPNIIFLNKGIDLSDLVFLNKNEHFDVVMALLIIHQIPPYQQMDNQIKIIKELFRLGDNVIIEVANNVDVQLTSYVESLAKSMKGYYLGEVVRLRDLSQITTGRLFWFRMKPLEKINEMSDGDHQGLLPETFSRMNGIYPKE